MNQPRRLRLRDVRSIFRLIGECRELGSDPVAWRRRMFEGLVGLTGAQVAIGGECRGLFGPQPQFPLTIDMGWADPSQRKHHLAFMRVVGLQADPKFPALRRFADRPLFTRTGGQLVPIDAWHRSSCYREFYKPGGVDDSLVSYSRVSGDAGVLNTINLLRPVGAEPFGERERRLVHWFHHELRPMLGRSLAMAGATNERTLPPRLRQVLDGLLAGDSEKQIARKLHISKHTVHEHIKRLHRWFGVQSRGELLARFIDPRSVRRV